MTTFKDWGEEEYKNQDRSTPRLLSKRVFKNPFHFEGTQTGGCQ